MLRCDCEHCDKKFQVKDEFAGKLIRCPQCREAVAVPPLTEPSASIPSPEIRPAACQRPSAPAVALAPAHGPLVGAAFSQRGMAPETETNSSKVGELSVERSRHRWWVAGIVIAALIASPFVPALPTWLGITILGLCTASFIHSAAERARLSSKVSAATTQGALGSRALAILPSMQDFSQSMLRLDNSSKWMSHLRLAMYGVLGAILFLVGQAGAVSQAEFEIAEARQATEDAELQKLNDEANSKVRSLVQEAEAAADGGDFGIANSRLDTASRIPHATVSNLIQAASIRLANGQVAVLGAEAIKALNVGDIEAAKQKIQEALAVPNANALVDVVTLERQITESTAPDHIRETLLVLSDDAFRELTQNHNLPASMASGYQSLDTRAAELAIAAMEDVAELRETQRVTRLEEERKQKEQSRLAAEEVARKAELEQKGEAEARLAAGTNAAKSERKIVRRGGTAYLEVQGEHVVWVSVDQDAFDELNSFSSARNEEAITQMMQQGRVLVCAKQTRVSVVDPGFFSTTIRILEGKHEGATGIVPNEFLHAELPGTSNPEARPGDARQNKSNSGSSLTVRSSKLVDFVSPATGQKMLLMIVTLKNNGSTPVRVVDADITWSDAAGNVIGMHNYTIYAASDSAPGIIPGGTWTTRKGEGFIIAYGPGIGEKATTVKVKITKASEHSEL